MWIQVCSADKPEVFSDILEGNAASDRREIAAGCDARFSSHFPRVHVVSIVHSSGLRAIRKYLKITVHLSRAITIIVTALEVNFL